MLLVLGPTAGIRSKAENAIELKSFRLENRSHPLEYDLYFILDESCFLARADIHLFFLEVSSSVELNCKELVFERIELRREDGTVLHGQALIDEETEIARIDFAGLAGPGEWILSLNYRGKVNTNLLGLYKSTWTTGEQTHTILSTHFEPVHARRVFPCFDEPSYKTPYNLSILCHRDYQVIANGLPCEDSVDLEEIPFFADRVGKGMKIHRFKQTVPISSYLVAFVVGELTPSPPLSISGVEIRVWSRVGDPRLCDFALKSAAFAIAFYEEFFGIAYPGKKVDLVALPDFPIGAMENMDCITFREDALLIDPADATRSSLVRVAEIVMHELAHMWFGNLVTMDWWNGLWLKESFATFLANLALDRWQPDWNVWTSFATTRMAAMSLDSLNSTHPIESPVNHPDEATEMFDMISYNKGCSILFQLHELIGPQVFRRGCEIYLKRHAGGCTSTGDLWRALAEACEEFGVSHPVEKLMNDWVFKAGHPVLEAMETASENMIRLSQSKFRLSGGNGKEDLWHIPLFLRTFKDAKIQNNYLTLSKKEETIYVPGDLDFSILNADGAGFYRVLYSGKLYRDLRAVLSSRLSNVERLNLVTDLFMSTLALRSDPEEYLELLEAYKEESEPQIWIFIASTCQQLLRVMKDPVAITSFKEIIHSLVAVNLEKLGMLSKEDDNQVERELRAILVALDGAIAEHEETLKVVEELYQGAITGNIAVDQELKVEVVKIAARNGDTERYRQYLSLSKDSTSPQEASRYIYALAHFKDSALIEQTLEHCRDGTIRTQDAPFVISRLLSGYDSGVPAWKFVREHFQFIKDNYPPISARKMLANLANLDRPDIALEIKTFFENNRFPGGDLAVAQMLESLETNLRFNEKCGPRLDRHFKKTAIRKP